MAETAKCYAWLGHSFEPRYDEEPLDRTVEYIEALDAAIYSPDGIERLLTKRTYVMDICVHCGAVVERPRP